MSAGDFDLIFSALQEPVADAPPDAAWLEHEAEQRRAWLRLTYEQRLAWLWEAKLFARRAAEARRIREAGAAPLSASLPADRDQG